MLDIVKKISTKIQKEYKEKKITKADRNKRLERVKKIENGMEEALLKS